MGTKTTNLEKTITHFTVTHWRSEIQHCKTGEKAFWGNNIILTGQSTGDHKVTRCVLSFYRELKEHYPNYNSGNNTIDLIYPYDQYAVILHFFQTAKKIIVVYDDTRGEKDIYAFLLNEDTPVL